jgi:hypothetical protein
MPIVMKKAGFIAHDVRELSLKRHRDISNLSGVMVSGPGVSGTDVTENGDWVATDQAPVKLST